jgi:putative endonuclease
LQSYFVYIIKSELDATLYKGFTTDYKKRIDEHNSKLSRYTSSKTPWSLVFVEEFPNKTDALKREKQLKRANKGYLLWLLNQPCNILNKK